MSVLAACAGEKQGRNDQAQTSNNPVPSAALNAVPKPAQVAPPDIQDASAFKHRQAKVSRRIPPRQSDTGKSTDLVNMETLLPDLELDIRYATSNNFAGQAVYPKARCLLRRPVARALVRVQKSLRASGHQLHIWDCYRPFSVQERFWELVPDGRYVARPRRQNGKPVKGSKHNRGAALDLSLQRLDGTPLPMPTDYDDFSKRAHRDSPLASKEQRENATLLRRAMHPQGFRGIPTEWWHFDHESWKSYDLSDQPL